MRIREEGEYSRQRNRRADLVVGCLLGGAVGDALGAEIKFWSLSGIRKRFGPEGMTEPKEGILRVSDETQMTLFTAEGLLRAISKQYELGICDASTLLHESYLRWYYTQERVWPEVHGKPHLDGWLIGQSELFARRAPGITCLGALGTGRRGTLHSPINTSKDCDGVMRVAPVACVDSLDWTFSIGQQAAAITHGHPSSHLAAGTFALIVRKLLDGQRLHEAVNAGLTRLQREEKHEEVSSAITKAIELATTQDAPKADVVERLGGGWSAADALSIAILCAMRHPDDYRSAILMAINHSGDSDSTGSMTGNIMGAMLGREAIPADWLERLELREAIEQIGRDLVTEHADTRQWLHRYPTW